MRLGEFMDYESASDASSNTSDIGEADSSGDEEMQNEGLLLRHRAGDPGVDLRARLRRPTVVLFGTTVVLSVVFTVCIVALARRSQDSVTLFVGAILSALLVALLTVATLFLCRSAFIAPIKFESMLVVIGVMQTAIFFTTVTTAVYHAAGVEFLRTLFEVLGAVDRLIVLVTTAVYGVMMLTVLAMFVHLSRVRASVYMNRARSVLDAGAKMHRRRARRLRTMQRAIFRAADTQLPRPPVAPASPPPMGVQLAPIGDAGSGDGYSSWNGGYGASAPHEYAAAAGDV